MLQSIKIEKKASFKSNIVKVLNFFVPKKLIYFLMKKNYTDFGIEVSNACNANCSFCACDLLFDWSRDMRRVITLSFPVQAKTRSTNRTRASRHSNSAAILGRSFVPRALKVAVSHTIIGPRETVANYGEGAKNSDRAAARFGLNRPIKSRQSHCRRESSEDRLLFFTRRT